MSLFFLLFFFNFCFCVRVLINEDICNHVEEEHNHVEYVCSPELLYFVFSHLVNEGSIECILEGGYKT